MYASRSLMIALLAFLLAGCTGSREGRDSASRQKPKNIIFLIGDGMGLSQVSSAYYYGNGEPNFSRFKDLGLINTSSASHKITDSAAGATSFASGVKTYNGAVGVDADTNSVSTIVEDLSEKGWNTGIISTSSITHATPACYYAHVKKRSMQEDIAMQLIQSQVDFFAGGGKKFFFDRSDGKNLYSSLQSAGFRVDTSSIADRIKDTSTKYGYLMGHNGLTPKHEGRDEFLTMATERALEYLGSQDAPFFLMIEGSQIDWGGHANDADYVIQETLEFDRVIGQVLDYAMKDKNTLVVVTADHETGGFTLSSEVKENEEGKKWSDYNSIAPTFSTGGHSTTLIPVFAWGKGSERFRGIYQNTHLHTLFKDLAGVK